MVRMSVPRWSKCVANVWRLFRARNNRHYLAPRVMLSN